MVKNHTIVFHVAEKEYASMRNERQHASNAKDQAFVSMIGFALNASHVKVVESVNMNEFEPPVRSVKEVQFVSMDGIGMSVKNVEGVHDVNITDIDIPAQNAMEPESANTESESFAVVNVEEPPYASMVANAPNASPVVDHHTANMTSFGLLVSPAHQK